MNVLYKTKLCNYALAGTCKHGQACLHAHSVEELREPPNFRKTKICRLYLQGTCYNDDCNRAHGKAELRIIDKYYKTKICKYWKIHGACIRGAECHFAHTELSHEKSDPAAEENGNWGSKLPDEPVRFQAAPASSTDAIGTGRGTALPPLKQFQPGNGWTQENSDRYFPWVLVPHDFNVAASVGAEIPTVPECLGVTKIHLPSTARKYGNQDDGSVGTPLDYFQEAQELLPHRNWKKFCDFLHLDSEISMIQNDFASPSTNRRWGTNEGCRSHRQMDEVVDYSEVSDSTGCGQSSSQVRETGDLVRRGCCTHDNYDTEDLSSLFAMLSISLLDSAAAATPTAGLKPSKNPVPRRALAEVSDSWCDMRYDSNGNDCDVQAVTVSSVFSDEFERYMSRRGDGGSPTEATTPYKVGGTAERFERVLPTLQNQLVNGNNSCVNLDRYGKLPETGSNVYYQQLATDLLLPHTSSFTHIASPGSPISSRCDIRDGFTERCSSRPDEATSVTATSSTTSVADCCWSGTTDGNNVDEKESYGNTHGTKGRTSEGYLEADVQEWHRLRADCRRTRRTSWSVDTNVLKRCGV